MICDRCLNTRPIISENGIHNICTKNLKSKTYIKVVSENRCKYFIENDMLIHKK